MVSVENSLTYIFLNKLFETNPCQHNNLLICLSIVALENYDYPKIKNNNLFKTKNWLVIKYVYLPKSYYYYKNATCKFVNK